MKYFRIHRLTELPDLSGLAPFKVVLTIEEPVSNERQREICTWLVGVGCRYAMVHGEMCQSWSDAIRQANLAAFDINAMTAGDFVMVVDHQSESLKTVFWYARKFAIHPERKLKECVVVHIGVYDRSSEYQSLYNRM